jgi:tetraacyldisaccharide 4'-kinase
VGNLTVGGSGKTPLAGAIARMLLEMGERPAILSRGYARAIKEDGVVIVSDGAQVLSGVERSGDEPLMLARQVPPAAVLVCPSRYTAGRLAETRLGCTVHVLDDGFQHFALARDVDLLIAPDPENDNRTLPFGRLREPLDAAKAADALLVDRGLGGAGLKSCATDASPPLFTFTRQIGGPTPDQPAFAFAGIAQPGRFFADLECAGWQLVGRRGFADHHRYSRRELEDVAARASAAGARVLLTTEKDIVRLEPIFGTIGGLSLPIVSIALSVSIDPTFSPWLAERLRAVRAG